MKRNLKQESSLMLDVFNSCIITGKFPANGSPCHAKVLELIALAGRTPTAGLGKYSELHKAIAEDV